MTRNQRRALPKPRQPFNWIEAIPWLVAGASIALAAYVVFTK